MRSLGALLSKELEQHAPALLGGFVLVLATLAGGWSFALVTERPTMMTAASGIVFYVLPLFTIFVAERLIVQDRSAGTHTFLAALPLSPLLRFAVQFVLGWFAVATTATLVLVLTALLASTREGVPLAWVGQLWLQFQLYVAAWFAVAFGIAHLGRIRMLTWWLLFSAFTLLDSPSVDAFRDVAWHGVLLDPIDQTRSIPPWSAVPVLLAWVAGGVGLGWTLAVARGGTWAERLFRPGHARSFAVQIVLALMVPTLMGMAFEAALYRTDDAWRELARLPIQGVDVRVAGPRDSALWRVGQDAARDLRTLRRRIDLGPLPTVVLVGGPADDLHDVRRAPGSQDDRNLVLVVDVAAHHGDLVREVVYLALLEHTEWLAGWNTKTDWLLRGAPGWLRPDPVLEARAAAGAVALPHVPDWLRMELEVGEDVAEGVAWAAVDALEDAEVEALLRHVLAHKVGRANYFSASGLRYHLRGDWVARVVGRELAPLWRDALQRRVPSSVAMDFGLHLEAEEGALRARWEGELPPEAQLRWRQLDPMSAHPAPGDEETLLPLDGVDGEAVLPVDPSHRVAAEIVWPDASLRGIRTTGWRARW